MSSPHLKPRILNDIRPRTAPSVYQAPARRVNLSYRRSFNISLTKFFKWATVFAASWFLILGSVAAPTTTTLAANTASQTAQEERAQLEAQLKDLEKQMDDYESQIKSYQKQGSSLKGEVSKLNTKIQKINLQIKAINLTMGQLDAKITDTQSKIVSTEMSLSEKRQVLGDLMRALYQQDHDNMVQVFLKNPKISDFFNDMNSISLLQNNVRTTINQITNLRDELQDQKEQFALAKADQETIKSYQLAQMQQTDQLKNQKSQLITITKGQEAKYQEMLKQTKATAAQIRSRIFQLLGGGELSFAQAYDYAKLASAATGVRAAIILAVLDRESALGQNVGKCKYNQIDSRTGRTTMHPTRDVPAFLELTAALGIDPLSVNVSCAIPSDGAYGGALGPAQFIPSTWKLYAPQISKITGRVANPWNNADAFIATALYMKNAGAANATVAQERQAAAKYYAGSNWSRFLWTYGQAVITRAEQFEDDIDAITS